MNEFIQSPLFENIREYLIKVKKNEQIFLYVPYIKTKILEELIEGIQSSINIITNWSEDNLLSGSSELELYPFCVKNKITLYTHEKIHLKVYSINLESAIISSGNISQRGLMPDKNQIGNYEVGTILKKLSSEDRLYLEKIKLEAKHIDDDLYKQYQEWYDKHPKPEKIKIEKIKLILKKDYFSRTALPMTRYVSNLIEGYQKIIKDLEPSDNSEISKCIIRDLSNYGIELGLSKEEFLKKLKTQFFSHPFIQKIDKIIEEGGDEVRFGMIRKEIENLITDIPPPDRPEINVCVNTIYDWFVKLGDGMYVEDIPGAYTHRIRKIKK